MKLLPIVWPVVEASMQPVANVAVFPFLPTVPESTEKKTRQDDNPHSPPPGRLTMRYRDVRASPQSSSTKYSKTSALSKVL